MSHSADDDGGHCTPLTPGDSGRPSPQIQHVPRRDGEEDPRTDPLAYMIYRTLDVMGVVRLTAKQAMWVASEVRAALPQPGGWRPISEAPSGQRETLLLTDGRAVLLGGRSWVCTGEQTPDGFWHTQSGSGWNPNFSFTPTHWQPLPPVPTDGGGEEDGSSCSQIAVQGTTALDPERLRSAGFQVHVLKTHPEPFAAVRARKKKLEIRRADRPFKEGDTLWLDEYDPTADTKSGEVEVRVITHILPGGQYGIEPGYVAMSIDDAPLSSEVQSFSQDGAANTFEVGKPLPYFCPACQAVPRVGYCKLSGCPTAPAENSDAVAVASSATCAGKEELDTINTSQNHPSTNGEG